MRYLFTLSFLVLIGTAAAAFELPLLERDPALTAESLLESASVRTLLLPDDPQAPAPAGRIKPSGPAPRADLAGSRLAGKNGNPLDLRSASGWASPFTRKQSVQDDSQAPVPEPAMLFLLGAGLIGLAGIVRRGLPQ